MQSSINDIVKLFYSLNASIRLTDAKINLYLKDYLEARKLSALCSIQDGNLSMTSKLLKIGSITLTAILADYIFTSARQQVRLQLVNENFVTSIRNKLILKSVHFSWFSFDDSTITIDIGILLRDNPQFNEYVSLLDYCKINLNIIENYIQIELSLNK